MTQLSLFHSNKIELLLLNQIPKNKAILDNWHGQTSQNAIRNYMFHYLSNKNQTSLCKPKNLKSTTLNKEMESKMYSKNESILDFKKKQQHKMTKEYHLFFFKTLNQVNFFQKVETDHLLHFCLYNLYKLLSLHCLIVLGCNRTGTCCACFFSHLSCLHLSLPFLHRHGLA